MNPRHLLAYTTNSPATPGEILFLPNPNPERNATQRSWSDISARVTSLAFSPSGSHLAASSLDESIRIYSVKSPSTILSLKNLCVFQSLGLS